MKPIKIDNEEMRKVVQSGNSLIQVGNRKFLLVEMEENNEGVYEVTDPEEEKQLLAALNEDNPILSETEIQNILRN